MHAECCYAACHNAECRHAGCCYYKMGINIQAKSSTTVNYERKNVLQNMRVRLFRFSIFLERKKEKKFLFYFIEETCLELICQD
jgi:hypothetical protein